MPTNAETVAKVTAGVQIGAGLLLARAAAAPRVGGAGISVVPGSLGGHPSGTKPTRRKAAERRAFLTDVGLIGGLIIAAVDTEGKPSLGWRGRRAARKLSESVSGALPMSGTGSALIDTELVEKVRPRAARRRRARPRTRTCRAGRGAELAEVARERGPSRPRSRVNARSPELAQKRPANRERPRPRRELAEPPVTAAQSGPKSRGNEHPSSPNRPRPRRRTRRRRPRPSAELAEHRSRPLPS